MADTTPDRAPDPAPLDRYMVLSDGETYEPLLGSKIVAVSAELDGDERDAAIKARCQHDDDDEEGAGVTVLYTAHGHEPGLADGQTTVPLSGAVGVIAAAPAPNGGVIGERRTLVIEFLGREGALSGEEMDVADLLARADTGDLLCDVKTTILEPLDGPTLARLATEARGEPGFFDLDEEDGRPLDPDES